MNVRRIISLSFGLLIIASNAACMIKPPKNKPNVNAAVRKGNYDNLKQWLESGTISGIDINEPQKDRLDQTTPFMWAVIDGNLPIVKLFLQYGANVNTIDALGGSILDKALKTGNRELIDLLIEKGAKKGPGKPSEHIDD
jgi:ankyrin repeat protein